MEGKVVLQAPLDIVWQEEEEYKDSVYMPIGLRRKGRILMHVGAD